MSEDESMALQVKEWNNMKRIKVTKKAALILKTELTSSQEYLVKYSFVSSKGAKWVFAAFKFKCNYTGFHAFTLAPDAVGPPFNDTSIDFKKRLDYNITIQEPIERLKDSVELTIHSFIMYKKVCALDFLNMLFSNFPKVRKISYPSANNGLEKAIRKSLFSYSKAAKTYVIYKP